VFNTTCSNNTPIPGSVSLENINCPFYESTGEGIASVKQEVQEKASLWKFNSLCLCVTQNLPESLKIWQWLDVELC